MALFALLGISLFAVASFVVGWRLLWLAHRTGMLPEKLIGGSLFLAGGVRHRAAYRLRLRRAGARRLFDRGDARDRLRHHGARRLHLAGVPARAGRRDGRRNLHRAALPVLRERLGLGPLSRRAPLRLLDDGRLRRSLCDVWLGWLRNAAPGHAGAPARADRAHSSRSSRTASCSGASARSRRTASGPTRCGASSRRTTTRPSSIWSRRCWAAPARSRSGWRSSRRSRIGGASRRAPFPPDPQRPSKATFATDLIHGFTASFV